MEKKDSISRDRMANLEKLVLIKFTEDTMIVPKETAWFETFEEKTDKI